MAYRGQEQPMDIGKSNDNFKDEKSKYFNYNKYGHMAKECQVKKKEQETRTYCQRLQRKANDEEEKGLGRIR